MKPEHVILVALVGGAAAAPYLARQLRIPAAALEILYGVLLFHWVFHEPPEWFRFLQELGFIYLMFIAGMELDLRALLRSPRLPWYLAAPAASLLLTPLAFYAVGGSPFLGLAVAMASAGIVIPVLKEADLMRTPAGRDLVGIALTGEVLSIALLTAVDTYHAHGISLQALLMLAKLVGLLLAAALVLRGLYVFSWWNQGWVDRVMRNRDPGEEGIRGVVVLAFAGALLAEAAGVEPILGSFMAGLITSWVFQNKGRFEEKISAIGFGFFTPFFFMGVGAELDLALFESRPVVLLAVGLSAAVLLSRCSLFAVARPLDLGLRQAGAMALLLSAPLSMMVVASSLGRRMGLLGAAESGALVLAAIVTSVLFPYLFRPLAHTLEAPSPPGGPTTPRLDRDDEG